MKQVFDINNASFKGKILHKRERRSRCNKKPRQCKGKITQTPNPNSFAVRGRSL